MTSSQRGYQHSTLLIGLGAVILIGALGAWWYRSQPKAPANPLEVQETDWQRGAIAPTVTMIEFSDFQCPACKAYHSLVKQLLDTFPTQLELVYRQYPLTQSHPNAFAAAMAAEAAGVQGKFFPMHDLLFEHQEDWSPLPNPSAKFEEYATQLGLDMNQFKKDSRSNASKATIKLQKATGDALRIRGTPTFFVNGNTFDNPTSFEEFKKIIDQAIAITPATESDTHTGEYHAHANFAVILNGTALDFTKDEYQSIEGKELNPNVHLHNKRGGVVHLHKQNSTWQELFQSLGMDVTKDCFTQSNTLKYCAKGEEKLSVILNGTELTEWENLPINDVDRLLITFGNHTPVQLQEEFKKVTDDACMFSEKCPERGTIDEKEPCVGGLGTKCD